GLGVGVSLRPADGPSPDSRTSSPRRLAPAATCARSADASDNPASPSSALSATSSLNPLARRERVGVRVLELPGTYQASLIKLSHSSSVKVFTPSSAAFLALDPASAPTIR